MTILKRAGVLFFLGGSIVLMGIITAEAFYPSNSHFALSYCFISK